MNRTVDNHESNPETGFARFGLAYDEDRAETFRESRISGQPEAFVVVKSVEFEGNRVLVPGTENTIDLKKTATFSVPVQFGKRLISCVQSVRTIDYDCYAFACDAMGVTATGRYLEGWTTMFNCTLPERPEACARMVPIDYYGIDDYAKRTREHWYVPIHPERGGTVLHVAGTEGPLMLSPIDIVRLMFSEKLEALATPRV